MLTNCLMNYIQPCLMKFAEWKTSKDEPTAYAVARQAYPKLLPRESESAVEGEGG